MGIGQHFQEGLRRHPTEEERHTDYLRWPRLIAFQLTSAFCVVAFSLASWALAIHYQNIRDLRAIPGATLDDHDIFSAGAYLSASAGLASLTCTITNLLVFGRVTKLWNKPDTDRSLLIKELVFGFEAVALLVAAIVCTSFVRGSATVTSPTIPQATILLLLKAAGKSLAYADVPAIVGFTVFAWLAWLSMTITTILVILAARHSHKVLRERAAAITTGNPRSSSAEEKSGYNHRA